MKATARRLTLLLALVRRDYAIQYAGMGLGLFWLLLQYGMQIGVFLLVFGKGDAVSYGPFLLSGMMLWLPLSEMLMRSGSVLAENRALIRRTAAGRDLFVWIPVMQALLHYLILALPLSILFFVTMDRPLLPLLGGMLAGFTILLFFSTWALLLARLAIILRDLGPLLRPLLQALFWLTPIAYMPVSWSIWNPLSALFTIHRYLMLGHPVSFDKFECASTALMIMLSCLAVLIASLRLNRLVEDHI